MLSPKAYAHILSMHTFCLLSAHFQLMFGLTFGPCSALSPSRSCTLCTICYAVLSSSLARTLKIGACLDGLGCMRHKKARRCAVANSGARRRLMPAAPRGCSHDHFSAHPACIGHTPLTRACNLRCRTGTLAISVSEPTRQEVACIFHIDLIYHCILPS